MTDILDALQTAVTGAAEKVGPSVVGLGRGWGRGSGVVLEPGRVLTVAHVLRGEEVGVTFADGQSAHGRVAAADSDLDVAVVAVDTGDAPAISWEPETVEARAAGASRARSSTPRRCRAAPRAGRSWTARAGCSG